MSDEILSAVIGIQGPMGDVTPVAEAARNEAVTAANTATAKAAEAAEKENNAATSANNAATSETNALAAKTQTEQFAAYCADILAALPYATQTDLFADLAHNANTKAAVWLDGDNNNNGLYLKVGASGTGSWQKSPYVTPLADRIVTPIKTTFFKPQKNIFNKNNVVAGYFVQYNSGSLVANAGYSASEYIEVLANTQYIRSYFYQMAFYDANKVYISGINSEVADPFTTPANCKYVRISVLNTVLSSYQLEQGAVATAYEAYKEVIHKADLEKHPFDVNDIPEKALTMQKMEFMTLGKNLFDKTKVASGYFVVYNTGFLTANASYAASDYIPVESNMQYIRSYDHQMAFYDANKVYISGINSGVTGAITTPINCAYLRTTVAIAVLDSMQIEKGTVSTVYEAYGYKIPRIILTNIATQEEVLAFLPSEICIAVGRTIEIYNRQVVWCGNHANYHFKWTCAVGKAMKRKWSLTAQASHVGTYPLMLTVYDNNMVAIAQVSTTIKVVPNVVDTKSILAIGDSLTNEKPWLQEVRTLSSNNITFVGSRGSGLLKHEGYSGWNAGTFLSAVTNDGYQGTQYTLTVSGITEPPAVGKEYTINGYRFSVAAASIAGGAGTIVINRIQSGSISMTNGTMIVYNASDGLAGDTSINYSAVVGASMNPFWDGSRFNYSYYKTKTGVNPDAIQIYLGTNGIALDPTINAGNIKQIVDYIRQDDATIPIFVVFTLYRGDQDGIGNQTSIDGYSAGSGVWKLEEDRKVFNLMVRLNDLLSGYSNLCFIPVSITHDSEYNFRSTTATVVNPRSTMTEYIDVEATHPSAQAAGYLQMADIMFSHFAGHYND